MTQWTETARQVFDRYCARTRQSLEGSGADADEVIDDLRRHVEEEAQSAKLAIVTEEDMHRILNRVGEPTNGEEKPPAQPASQPQGQTGTAAGEERVRPGFWLVLFGVIMPFITLVFEGFTGMSAGVLFDPMPTWFHVGLIALVPLTNLWIWRAAREKDTRHKNLLGWLNGVALGVSVWYGILYLAFLPIACMAVIAFGAGLLALGPYFGLIGTPLLRLSYRKRIGVKKLPGAGWGLVLGFGLLAALHVPTAATYYGLSRAVDEDPVVSRKAVNILRSLGDRELMLRACYGMIMRNSVDFDLTRQMFSDGHDISADQARAVYFRVTGEPFNAVPPPAMFTRRGRWSALEEDFAWDPALGGEAVAGRIKGLSLQSSRLDAAVDANGAAVYTEWTLEFKNVSRRAREARAQIALPPGGVVSRLTLWVNGEPREAAFSGRSEVRQAYQKVAVERRRDPVLVTTCGPDRILMQCFPVPADGGTMKVRIGITAPLALDTADRGRFSWPRFLERNFGVPNEFRHSLWIESSAKLSAANTALKVENPRPDFFTLHGSVSETGMSAAADTVLVERPGNVTDTWTSALEPDTVIVQRIRATTPQPPSRVVFVIDGSIGMREALPALVRAFGKLPETLDVKVLIAGDEVFTTGRHQVGSFPYIGGQDNLPALEEAWDLASGGTNGVVVWIHEAQPYLLSSTDGLLQRFDRAAHAVRLVDFQVGQGPNRIAEKLDGLSDVSYAPRFGKVDEDLVRLASGWDGKTPVMEITRERVARRGEPSGKEASRHIERLWARDESERLAKHRQRAAAAALAAAHQLVTPVSGAVVLETQQQYAENNLTPADPTTVPSVPEPGTWALLVLGGAALLGRRFLPARVKGRVTS